VYLSWASSCYPCSWPLQTTSTVVLGACNNKCTFNDIALRSWRYFLSHILSKLIPWILYIVQHITCCLYLFSSFGYRSGTVSLTVSYTTWISFNFVHIILPRYSQDATIQFALWILFGSFFPALAARIRVKKQNGEYLPESLKINNFFQSLSHILR
jgi:hypothetical protein